MDRYERFEDYCLQVLDLLETKYDFTLANWRQQLPAYYNYRYTPEQATNHIARCCRLKAKP